MKEWTRLVRTEIIPVFGDRQASELTRVEIRSWADRIAGSASRPRRDGRRQRRRFNIGAGAIARPYTDAVRLLLLSGVRRDMVLGMRRSELEDIGGREPRWAIPGGFAGRSKSGRPHVVPLSPQALDVIEPRLEEMELGTLFPPNRVAEADFMSWSHRFVRELKEKTEQILRARMSR